MLLCSPAARASHWQVTVTDKGGSNNTFKGYSHPWQPPDPGNNTISLSGYAAETIGGPDDTRNVNVSSTLNVTVTLTWVADPTSDPAPPSVWVVETADASSFAAGAGATSAANDGLPGDVYQKDPPAFDQDGGSMTTPPNLPGGGRLKKLTVSGGSASFDRSLSASGSSTYSDLDWFPDLQTASLSYTLTIHAQPYNYHQTNVTDNGDGTLTFYYDWLSTDGNKADLTSCYFHEYVTYPGPVGTAMFPIYYTMPTPFNGSLPNPTVLPGIGSSGQPMTTPEVVDDQNMPSLIPFPHVTGSFTGTQKYEFDDTATGETDTIIPGPDSGPLSIVRSVYSQGGILWYYSVTKSGYTATKSI